MEDKEKITEQGAQTQENEEQTCDKQKSEKKEKKPKKEKSDKQLEQLKSDLASLNDRYLRTLAEYDNFRKRTLRELDSRVQLTKVDMLQKLVPLLDNIERARVNGEAGYDDYKKGVEMIFNQLEDILKGVGLEEFGAVGDKFDPNIHNAVMHVDDEQLGENEVADVFMKGYKIGERIVRPATVKVAN